MKITVAIIEADGAFHDHLRTLLAEAPGFSCIQACPNLRAALRQIPPLAPDVIVMDIDFPGDSGIDGAARLKRLLPQTEILIYSHCDDPEQICQSLAAGAGGYLQKKADPADLLAAIRELKSGGGPMSKEIARKVIHSFRKTPRLNSAADSLTKREEEVLDLLAKGSRSREISEALGVGLETVNSHLKHIYEKLHVHSRTEAVIKYLA